MKELGILLIVISGAMWITTTGIISHILRDDMFKQFLIFRGYKKMLVLVIILSSLMFIFAFIGGKCV